MDTTHTIITEFINEKHNSTTEGQLEIIRTTNDFATLIKYYDHCNDYSTISIAVTERLAVIAPGILAKESDVMVLVKFYAEKFLSTHCNPLAKYVLVRIEEILGTMNELEAVFALHKNACTECLIESQYPAILLIEDRIVAIAKKHPNHTSFTFLIEIRRRMCQGLGGVKKLDQLIPASIDTVTDLELLAKYYKMTYSSWNRHKNDAARAVCARQNTVVMDNLPTTTDIKTLEQYRDLCFMENETIIDQHIAAIANATMATMDTIAEILDYKKQFNFDRHRVITAIKKSFHDRLLAVTRQTVERISNIKTALYYFKKLEDEPAARELVAKKINTLVVPFFANKNNSLRLALKWNRELKYHVPQWDSVLNQLLKREKDPTLLVQALDDNFVVGLNLYDSISGTTARNRLFELIANMKKPNSFFLYCLKNQKFYNDEQFFIQKAKEFANAA